MTLEGMTLATKLEALLFYRAEPVAITALAKDCGAEPAAVTAALGELEAALAGRGLALIHESGRVALGTAPAVGEWLATLAREEQGAELSRAALETLTIVLYQGATSRASIDYIRGVNSSFILRHLAVRGLVERIPNPDDARSFLYRPTAELLAHLGITRLEDLPEHDALQQKLAASFAAESAS